MAVESCFVGLSGLKVSNIALGICSFQREFLHELLDIFYKNGGYFFVFLDVMEGLEESFAEWLEDRKINRESVVISSHLFPRQSIDQLPNQYGSSRAHIRRSIPLLLSRLNVEYLDVLELYYYDQGTPLQETLRTLNDFIQQGTINYLTAGHVTGWQLQKIVCTSKQLDMEPIVALQPAYSLYERNIEREHFSVCRNEGLGVIADMSFPAPRNATICESVASVAERHGITEKLVEFSWLKEKLGITSILVSPTSPNELLDYMTCPPLGPIGEQLEKETRPAPLYPYQNIKQWHESSKRRRFNRK